MPKNTLVALAAILSSFVVGGRSNGQEKDVEAIEFAGVNQFDFCAAAFGSGGVWVLGLTSS